MKVDYLVFMNQYFICVQLIKDDLAPEGPRPKGHTRTLTRPIPRTWPKNSSSSTRTSRIKPKCSGRSLLRPKLLAQNQHVLGPISWPKTFGAACCDQLHAESRTRLLRRPCRRLPSHGQRPSPSSSFAARNYVSLHEPAPRLLRRPCRRLSTRTTLRRFWS